VRRSESVRYLAAQGCKLLREGGRYSWWHNPDQNKRSAIPRHNEIKDILANKICKDLGVKPVK